MLTFLTDCADYRCLAHLLSVTNECVAPLGRINNKDTVIEAVVVCVSRYCSWQCIRMAVE